MKIVSAKCPNCGGILEVDSEKDAAICQFCQTPFIVEKAIENYYITNNYTTANNTYNKTINNISGQEVHVHQGGETADQLFANMKALLKRKELELANKTFQKLKEKYPSDYCVDEGKFILRLENIRTHAHDCGYDYDLGMLSYYEILDLEKLLERVKETNFSAYAQYYNSLLIQINSKLREICGKEFSGRMLFTKAHIISLLRLGKKGLMMKDGLIRFTGYDSNTLGEWHIVYENYLFSYYDKFEKVINEISSDDVDDEFIIYLSTQFENTVVWSQKWEPEPGYPTKWLNEGLPHWRSVKLQREKRVLQLRESLFFHLSPEGKKKYNEEQERIKKEQRRNAIKTVWKNYVKLLRANSAKDAYNLLLSNSLIKGVKGELANFKKGLLGVKYLGDISAFNVNEVIAE